MRILALLLIGLYSLAGQAENRAVPLTAEFTFEDGSGFIESFLWGRARNTQAIVLQESTARLLAQGLRNQGLAHDAQLLHDTFTYFGPLYFIYENGYYYFEPLNWFINVQPVSIKSFLYFPDTSTIETSISPLCQCQQEDMSSVLFGDHAVELLSSGLETLGDSGLAVNAIALWHQKNHEDDLRLPSFVFVSKAIEEVLDEDEAIIDNLSPLLMKLFNKRYYISSGGGGGGGGDDVGSE